MFYVLGLYHQTLNTFMVNNTYFKKGMSKNIFYKEGKNSLIKTNNFFVVSLMLC